jgi:hypothetical protein
MDVRGEMFAQKLQHMVLFGRGRMRSVGRVGGILIITERKFGVFEICT